MHFTGFSGFIARGCRRVAVTGCALVILGLAGGAPVPADAAVTDAADRVRLAGQIQQALLPRGGVEALNGNNIADMFGAFSRMVADPPVGVEPGYATFVFSDLVEMFLTSGGDDETPARFAERLAAIKAAVARLQNAPGSAEMMAGLGVAFARAERNIAALAQSRRDRLASLSVELKRDENGRFYVDQPFNIGTDRGGLTFNELTEGEGTAAGRRYPTEEQLEAISEHNRAIGDEITRSRDLETARLDAMNSFLHDSDDSFISNGAFSKSYEYIMEKTRPGPENGWMPGYISAYYDSNLISEALSAGLGQPVTSFMTPGQRQLYQDEQAAQQALATLQGEGQAQLGNPANSLAKVGPRCPRNPSPSVPCP